MQRLVSAYKARHLTKKGAGTVIKHNVELCLTDNAVCVVGSNCTIQNFAYFQLTKPHPKLYIGNNTVIGRHCMITCKNLIRIGDNVLIGGYVQLVDHNHGFRADLIIRNQPAEIGEVVIGNDVWIGAGVKILMNCHVGDGAIIGSNSVVTGDIPKNAIAVGIPARVIKYRE